MKKKNNIYTGIELGSDMIRVVVASFRDPERGDSDLIIRGFAEVPSLKILKDEPVNPNIVEEQLRLALGTAWEMAGIEGEKSVISLAFSGNYIRQQVVEATVDVDLSVAISEEDCEEVANAASLKAITMLDPDAREASSALSMLNKRFRVGNGTYFFNPVGQYSEKLTIESIFFPMDVPRYNRIVMLLCSVLPGLQNFQQVYAPVAVTSAILQPTVADEPQGLVVDLGAGMTSYAIPSRWGFAACGQLAVGTDHLANDLSIAFSLKIETAKKIVHDLTSLNLTIVATNDGDARRFSVMEKGTENPPKEIPASEIEAVLEARMKEVFQIIKQRLIDQDVYQWVGNEILLTGVGATLPRITELASSVLGRRVRVAMPYQVIGCAGFQLDPRFTMVLGLLRAACVEERIREEREALSGGFLGKIKNWFTVASDC